MAIMPDGVEGALRSLWPETEVARATPKPVAAQGPTVESVAQMIPVEEVTERTAQVVPANFEVPMISPDATPITNQWDKTSSPQPGQIPAIAHRQDPAAQSVDAIEKTLLNLGATYYRLESWGTSPRQYRFHCTVSIQIGTAEYSRRFEASGQSPNEAMLRVQQQVQDWHSRFPDMVVPNDPNVRW